MSGFRIFFLMLVAYGLIAYMGFKTGVQYARFAVGTCMGQVAGESPSKEFVRCFYREIGVLK